MQKYIVLVGYRKEALIAAKAQGLSVILWTDKSPLPTAKKLADKILFAPFPTASNALLSKNINDFFSTFAKIESIIALTEASLVPKALLKESLFQKKSLSHTLICHDKYLMKQHAKNYGVAVAEFELFKNKEKTKNLLKKWGLPVYAKLRADSGSRGLIKIDSEKALGKIDQKNYLLEKNINGTEISVELFIQNEKIIFKNTTQYLEHLKTNVVPLNLPQKQKKQLAVFIENTVNAFQIRHGIVHLECFLTKNNLVLGELTLRPPGGYLMKLIQMVYNFNPWEAYINIELEKTFTIPHQPHGYAAIHILHPGAGTIKSITGIELIEKLPGVQKIKLKKRVNDQVEERVGSGQDIGYILLQHKDHNTIIHSLKEIKKHLKIIMK